MSLIERVWRAVAPAVAGLVSAVLAVRVAPFRSNILLATMAAVAVGIVCGLVGTVLRRVGRGARQ